MATDLFKANIIQLLGLTKLPTVKQVALVNKMTEYAQKRIMLRILNDLDDTGRQQAEKVFTKGSDADKMKFFQSLPNLQSIFEQEIVAVKKELLDEAKRAKA